MSGKRPEGIAVAPKVSNPSLWYLASHARIAIHLGSFSPQLAEMAQRTRNKIAQAGPAALRELPVIPRRPFAARKLNSRVEES
ncbi:MAG: hypothetical protein E6G85_00025 [Alphaproteobacteria bacterium]|nr:MAG: hypothetical protein E6G85_00025 [Alphaproteobacteria bacterium]